MNRILTTMVLMTFLFSGLLLGETMDDLEKRDGLYYKEFTDVPFTGNITGTKQGTIRIGKKHGPWVFYHDNGQLDSEGTFKDGNPAFSADFSEEIDRSVGILKDGKREGLWFGYTDKRHL